MKRRTLFFAVLFALLADLPDSGVLPIPGGAARLDGARRAIDALNAGKNVMLEKPMCLNADLARKVVAARDANKKVLQIGMVRRQSTEADIIKKLIEDGRLGDVYQIRVKLIRRRGIPGLGGWFTTKALSGGGGIIDISVHALDLSMYVTGLWNPTAVSAKTYSKFGSPIKDYHYVSMWAGPPKMDGIFDVDDYAAGLIRFGDKATLSFEVAWACNAHPENCIGCAICARMCPDGAIDVYR